VVMFAVDDLVAACRAALTESEPRRAIHEVLDRVLAKPSEVADVLGGARGGIRKVHNAPDLTILNVIWAPGMSLRPHDHRMWAAIGVYGGEEQNTFYRRDPEAGLAQSGGKQLQARDVVLLGDATIHSVANPRSHEFTGAIHVYNGDFFTQPRSQWDPETLVESPYDMTATNAAFEAANAAWSARST
jgi:predicted metal-dependent enzyme (double-stranded beta helix superfamily)